MNKRMVKNSFVHTKQRRSADDCCYHHVLAAHKDMHHKINPSHQGCQSTSKSHLQMTLVEEDTKK
jgi:hypothetical protein